MDALEVRFVPQASAFQFGRPSRAASTQITNGLDKGSPVVAIDARWHGRIGKLANGVGSLRKEVEHAQRRGRAHTWHQLLQPETGNAVARVFDKSQQRQHVLDVRGIEKFESQT